MEENKTRSTLYFPQGLRRKREYFDGYGGKELCITIFTTLGIGMIDLIQYMITGSTIKTIFILLGGFFLTILVVTRDASNTSVVDQINFMLRFAKSQKEYPYIYQDEWR